MQSEKNIELPIKLSAVDAAQNPEFVNLLHELTQHLTPEGVSFCVNKELKQAEETLRHERNAWFESHVLHRELTELITDYDIKETTSDASKADQEFKEILEQCLNFAEAEDYLSFTPDLELNLLNLTPADIEASNPYKKHIPILMEKLIPELESRLRRRTEILVGFFGTATFTDGDELTLAKAAQLPAMVEKAQRILEDEKRQIKAARQKREDQFWVYFKALSDSLGMMERMVSEYRLGKQANHGQVAVECVIARCDAMCMKIKYVRMQILCDTYTAETVAALQKIRDHIKDEAEIRNKDLDRAKQSLHAFSSVGYGFEELAEEYSRLKQELENKEWALKEIDKSNS